MKMLRVLVLAVVLSTVLSASVFGASVCPDCGSSICVVDSFAGTCERKGYVVEECIDSTCGYRKKTYTGYGDHKFITQSETPSTCIEHGERLSRCQYCSMTNQERLPLDYSRHQWEYYPPVPSTCSEHGYEMRKCGVCGVAEKEYFPLDDTAHDYQSSFVQPATCIHDGYDRQTCSFCESSFDVVIPADGESHDFVFIEQRTDDLGTFDYFECSYCSVPKSEYIPVIHEHHYTESNRIDATSDVPGTVIYTCSCGSVYYAELDYVEPVPATTANLAKTVLTGVWGFFGIYVPGFNFTFGQMALGIVLCSASVYMIRFLFNLGGSGVSSRTSSTNKPRISDERKGDQY